MNLDDKILELLKETANRFFYLQKEIAATLNIKKNFYKILLKLGLEKAPLNQTQLGEVCGIDKPATSRLVSEMEEEGLIKKSFKDGNKKELFVFLSENGEKILKQINKLTNELKTKYFKEVDDESKKALINIFENSLLKE